MDLGGAGFIVFKIWLFYNDPMNTILRGPCVLGILGMSIYFSVNNNL